MGRLSEWASDRWDERFSVDDNPVLRVDDAEIDFATASREVEQRRVSLYSALGSLGADAALLRELDAFEAACGLLGVLTGLSAKTPASEAAGMSPEGGETSKSPVEN